MAGLAFVSVIGLAAAAPSASTYKIGNIPVANLHEAYTEKLGSRYRRQDAEETTEMSFIITTNTVRAARAMCRRATRMRRCSCDYVYERAIVGASLSCTARNLNRQLSRAEQANIVIIEASLTAHAIGTQSNPVWGLDQMDGVDDNVYNYPNDGSAATVYVLDTGIDCASTWSGVDEWSGRCSAPNEASFIDGEPNIDEQGHGTHCAGTIGSLSYGVAKNVNLVSVRVLNAQGSGTYAGIIAGIDWVIAQTGTPRRIMSMSLGGGRSTAVNTAVNNAVAGGVAVAVAAGNDNSDACNYSPASAADVVSVGAVTESLRRSSFSNFGSCVDIFAPGSDIVSTLPGGQTSSYSGTSMACPHVAGAMALYWTENPNQNNAAVVQATVVSSGTRDAVDDPQGTANILANVNFGPPPPTAPPTPFPANYLFRITSSSSSSACQLTNSGTCITDGVGEQHGNNERCSITVRFNLVLDVREWEVENNFDFLTVGGTQYTGTSRPDGVSVAAGTVISWSSDGSVVGDGFTVCGTTSGPPPPTPPPVSQPTPSPQTSQPTPSPQTSSPIPSPTTAPPTPTSPAIFSIRSSNPAGACYTTTSGTCITDGPGRHENNERCSITVLQDATLRADEWGVENRYDTLTIAGTSYTGTSSPDGVSVSAGDEITWATDYSVTYDGFTLCGVTAGPPSPTTTSPTPSPSTSSPTPSPTPSPATSSPTTSSPTPSPATSSPTPSPATSSPTTSSPTPSPTTSSPTTSSPTTSSPTTSPPSPSSQPLFTVTAASPNADTCVTTNAGTCFTDGAGAHANNERCTIRVEQDVVLSVNSGQWDVENYWDHLTVNGVRFSGSSPDGVRVAANGIISWASDVSVTNEGFVVCGSPAPPTPPSTDYFSVRSASPAGACSVVEVNGRQCFTEGSGDYANNERCTIDVLRATTLRVNSFTTERYFDYLTVDGRRYSGNSNPNGVVVVPGDVIQWRSDSSVTGGGFEICA